jgi:hypothetical protein
MAIINKTGITDGSTIQAEHVTRAIDALSGGSTDSIIATGSLFGTASFALTASYISGSGADTNFANTNLTFAANRSHNLNGNDLEIIQAGGGRLAIYNEFSTQVGYGNSYLEMYDNGIVDFYGSGSLKLLLNPTASIFNADSGNVDFFTKASGSSVTAQNMFVVDSSTQRIGVRKFPTSANLDISGSVLVTGSLSVSGSITGRYRNINASVNNILPGAPIEELDYVVTFTGNTPGVGEKNVIVMPTPQPGRQVIIQRAVGIAPTTITGSLSGQNINGATSYAFPTTLYTQRIFISNGTVWFTEP